MLLTDTSTALLLVSIIRKENDTKSSLKRERGGQRERGRKRERGREREGEGERERVTSCLSLTYPELSHLHLIDFSFFETFVLLHWA